MSSFAINVTKAERNNVAKLTLANVSFVFANKLFNKLQKLTTTATSDKALIIKSPKFLLIKSIIVKFNCCYYCLLRLG